MQRLVELFIDSIVLNPDEYGDFVCSNDYNSLELLKTTVLESLSNLDKLPKPLILIKKPSKWISKLFIRVCLEKSK